MNRLKHFALFMAWFHIQLLLHGQDTNAPSAIIQANNAFALDLYARLAANSALTDFVISPFSVDTALSMALAGARGTTARQMANVLHYSNTNSDVRSAGSDIPGQENALDARTLQFHAAQSVWAQRGFHINKSFQTLLQARYHLRLAQIDLTGWPSAFDSQIADAACAKINDWIAANTFGEISNAIPRNLIRQNTRLLLLATACFKGLWQTRFDSEAITDEPFYVSPDKSVSVPMMHVHGTFPYLIKGSLDLIRIPYASNRLSLVIILPDNFEGFSELQTNLAELSTGEFDYIYANAPRLKRPFLWIDQACQCMGSEEMDLSMPRFSITSEFDLNHSLETLGMTNALDATTADFSGITPVVPFFIDRTIHLAKLTVDEQGAEASAVAGDSAARAMDALFLVNHPFIYLIRDDQNGAILFIGRVIDPSRDK